MRSRTSIAVVAALALAVLMWFATRESTSRSPQAPIVAAPRVEESGEALAPPAERELTPERSALESLPATEVAASPKSRLVRLVDDRTGEPVPHFGGVIRSGERSQAFESREDGRFELSDGPQDLALVLELTENARDAPDRNQTRPDGAAAFPKEVEFDAAASEVAIPVGPTYRLALSVPAGYELESLLATLRSADPTQMFDVASALVRAGTPPWTRFRPTARILGGGPKFRLTLETPDSLHQASAIVATNVGIAPEVVELVFEPRARLEGVVYDESGVPFDAGSVRIERDGAAFSDAANRPMFGHLNVYGRYSVRGAPPGEYTVRFYCETFEPFQQRIVLAPGEVRELDITMRKLDASGLSRIAGRVESLTGKFDDRLFVSLRPKDPNGRTRTGPVTWRDEAGRRVGSFAFEEVPLGAYQVSVFGQRLRDVEPPSVELVVGDAEPVFTIRDDTRTSKVIARALDEAGAPLAQFKLDLRLPRGGYELGDSTTAQDGVATIRYVPIGSKCRYKVHATDRKPVWGELEIAERANELTVTLAPGWGTEVAVVAEAGGPLGGARVFFDDVFAGETSERGSLRVALDKVPELARVEYRDWVRADSSRLGADGRFRAFEPWLYVVLKPASR